MSPKVEEIVNQVAMKWKVSKKDLFRHNPTQQIFLASNEVVWRLREELLYNGATPKGVRIAIWLGTKPHVIWKHLRRGKLYGKESDPIQRASQQR